MKIEKGHRIYIHNTNCSLVKSSGTNQHTLRLRVTHDCNRIDLRTRIRIEPKLWDKKRQKVKQGYNLNGNSYNDVNSTINTYIQYVDDYFRECELMKRDPVLTDLRAKFNYAFKQTSEQRSNEFFLLFNEFIQEQSGVKGWGKDMVDVYTRLRDKLQKFTPNLTFLTLNTKNLEAIKVHLSESMYNDALKKNLAYLKSFVKWAKEKHYTVCEEFDSYKPKLPKGHIAVKYLSLDELDRIYNLKLEEGTALDQTRDFFVFQCYTALRYSDLKQLRPDNITKSDDGKFIIRQQIAAQNRMRYMRFFEDAPKLPAILAYHGQAYKHLKAETLNVNDLNYSRGKLWITSFLYGLLRPLDGIQNSPSSG